MAKHRLPEKIVGILEDALESAELKRASFGFCDDKPGTKITITWPRDGDEKEPWSKTVEKGLTDFIRDETRLYRQSWIIARIREVLEWSKSKDDGSMLEYELLSRVKHGKFPHPDNLDDMVKEIEELRERNAELEAFKRRVEGGLEALNKEVARG